MLGRLDAEAQVASQRDHVLDLPTRLLCLILRCERPFGSTQEVSSRNQGLRNQLKQETRGSVGESEVRTTAATTTNRTTKTIVARGKMSNQMLSMVVSRWPLYRTKNHK